MKICILQPIYRIIPSETYMSIINLLTHFLNNGISYAHCINDKNAVDVSRNKLTKTFIDIHSKVNFDYVLWLDSDHVFNPADIQFLVDSIHKNNYDIVTARYNVRGTDKTVLCSFRKNKNEINKYDSVIPLDNGLEEIDACGFGSIIMKADVLKHLFIDYQEKLFEFETNGIDTTKGEDFSFCEKAKLNGYKIWLNNDVHIGHWGFVI